MKNKCFYHHRQQKVEEPRSQAYNDPVSISGPDGEAGPEKTFSDTPVEEDYKTRSAKNGCDQIRKERSLERFPLRPLEDAMEQGTFYNDQWNQGCNYTESPTKWGDDYIGKTPAKVGNVRWKDAYRFTLR